LKEEAKEFYFMVKYNHSILGHRLKKSKGKRKYLQYLNPQSLSELPKNKKKGKKIFKIKRMKLR
jgi:hypothetical protein